jgi:DNA-binding NarL/FixJ family response regulator
MPQPDSRQGPMPYGAVLPLQGLTLLVVEDSRFASEALRLMALRSGARMRRAESLRDARRHLALYRPDAVLVDLGLPDGSGTTLIRDLATAAPDAPVVLGLSGDPDGRGPALAAGAAGFIAKPLAGLAAFQAAMLRHLPGRGEPDLAAPPALPDRLALREDLVHAASLLADDPPPGQRRYLARFLAGLARASDDGALATAAAGLDGDDPAAWQQAAGLVALRIDQTPSPFARSAVQ